MTRRVVTTRRAHQDIDAAVDYYLAEDAVDAALGLADAIQDATSLIAQYSAIGSTRFAADVGIPGLRSLALPRFPYILFYTEEIDAVHVLRVLRTRRDIPEELSRTL